MSILDNVMAKVEKTILDTMSSRMRIETNFCPKTLYLTTSTYLDDILVSEVDFDANPMADAIEKRIRKNL